MSALAVAEDLEDGVAVGRGIHDQLAKVAHGLMARERLVVEADDDVAFLEPRLGRRLVGQHLGDDDGAVGDAQLLGAGPGAFRRARCPGSRAAPRPGR